MHHCRIEEMIMVHYGSFAALSERVKVLAQSSGCSKRVTKCTLRFQLFLDEMRKINPNWWVACQQECGLFLLEQLFHTAASMRQRERQQHRNHCICSHHLGDSWEHNPNPTICEKPAGVIQGDPWNYWAAVLGGVWACSQWTPLPETGGLPGRVACWAGLAPNKS